MSSKEYLLEKLILEKGFRQKVNLVSDNFFPCKDQGRSSTKIVGEGEEAKSWKNLGHHVWPTEKILGFEWPKTAQMAFKFFYFFRNIFKYVQDFSCLSKQFFRAFSIDGFFKKGFFIEIQRYFCLKCKDLDLV